MSTIQVRSMGSYGFDVTPLSGLGLSTADATTTRTRVSDAQALASAIRQALQAARDAGVQAFKPTDDELTLPAGMTDANRDGLFNTVIGRAYSGGPIRLSDWSRAVDELEHWAGQQASMLPPEAGGGSRNVRGIWYVNGLSWSLSELFTVNRVNTLSEIDRMVAESLNVIAANNQAAKSLTSLMQELFDKYYEMDTTGRASKKEIEAAGLADAAHPISFDQLLAYADKYIGPGSMIRKLEELEEGFPDYVVNNSTGFGYDIGEVARYNGELYEVYKLRGGPPPLATFKVGDATTPPTDTRYWRPYSPSLSRDDFRALIDEVETIIGAFGSDNQVAQLRNETLFNSRSNLLEGLSSFLKGQQTTRSTLARNV